jgi:anaphase-promoting complex subunit 1
MIVIMELNGTMSIYSGTSFVGKLHIPSIIPNIVGNSYVLSHFYARELLSPYPRRSSLISPSRSSTPHIQFDEGVHLLSPVSGTNINIVDTSLIENSPLYIRSAVSNNMILEYGDSNFFKVTLPTHKSSPLGMYK